MTILATTMMMAQQFNEVQYTSEQTIFALFAPEQAKTVKLRLYKDGLGGKAFKTVKMAWREGRWRAEVKGDLKGCFYTFDIGRGETPGVFAKAVGVRQSVYRMGGDEFIVVCRKTSKEDVENIVRKIQESVAQTKYSCSIGYSYHEPGTIKLEDLLKESDKQMYSDKEGFYKNKGNQPL